MISIAFFSEILKENHLWIAEQFLEKESYLFGKPVTDSRRINPGDAFICIRGYQSDGHIYINQARELGAAIVIQQDEFSDSKPAIRVSNSRKAAALLAKIYFDNPTSKFTLIGVTGTNGKTTTSLLIWQALKNLGYKTGWIGTFGFQVESGITPTNNTTPDIIEINSIFSMMADKGCNYVVMEVSSHALTLDRIYGLEFDFALFTNLSRDHLDFHKNMTDYFESKYKLFEYTMKQLGTCIINIDDDYGAIIDKRIFSLNYYKKVTVSEFEGNFVVQDYISNINECNFSLKVNNDPEINIHTKLIGHFNMFNTVMAIATIKVLFPNLTSLKIQEIVKSFTPIKGRLEQIENDKKIGIFVDYAHTPDALKQVLKTLKQLPHKRIHTIFGAGGDRDLGKRSEMLKIVLMYSDTAIITDDNPRTEDPNQIIRDIVDDNNTWDPWWIIRNRKQAIKSALRLSLPGDLVLIAGKGHETYQEKKSVKYYFDDGKVAKLLLEDDNDLQLSELVLPVDPVLMELLYKSPYRYSSDEDKNYKFISTDSRTIKSATLFFAIKGESYDGFDYLYNVLIEKSNGAVLGINTNEHEDTIYYPDTQKAFGLLAKKYLKMFDVQKIAFTGSTGKSTTKEYLSNIFSEHVKTLKTFANENNIIGLSKTIFNIKPTDKAAIFELGTNHFGEIKVLADIINPDIGMIINIGPSHLEFLKDEKGVYEEKTDLFRTNLKIKIFPGDDGRFNEFSESGVSVGYGKKCNYVIENVKLINNLIEMLINRKKWEIPQIVPFYVDNIAFAIVCALESGIPEKCIKIGLQKPIDLQMRMQIQRDGDKIYIIDCYNANPVSMKAAIKFWSSYYPSKKHIAILGDMLELGVKAIEYHKSIGILLSQIQFESLFTIGDLAKNFALIDKKKPTDKVKSNFRHYPDVEAIISDKVLSSLPNNSVILIKASHGIHLEQLLKSFMQVKNVKPLNNTKTGG